MATVGQDPNWFPKFTAYFEGAHECRNPKTNRKLVPCGSFGLHFHEPEWRQYVDSLTPAQVQSLRDKARWEHMTLSAVAIEWGDDPEVA